MEASRYASHGNMIGNGGIKVNRLELEKQIIERGKEKGIKIISCRIYSRKDDIDFYPEIQNNCAKDWIYKHQVEEIISDLAPLERPHTINKIELDKSRYDLFKIGDEIEIDNIWIRLDAEEKEPEIIKVGSCCGQYRQGWMLGKVIETPKQNDRALQIIFDRDIYIEKDNYEHIGNVTGLERLIREGKINKIEKGQSIYSGTHVWTIRKP